MGLDAYIFFAQKPDAESDVTLDLPAGYTVLPFKECGDLSECYGAVTPTHEVDCGPTRYYSPQYPSSGWPLLCMVVLQLLTNPSVELVWYGHDSWHRPFSGEDVLHYTRHYLGRES